MISKQIVLVMFNSETTRFARIVDRLRSERRLGVWHRGRLESNRYGVGGKVVG